MEQTKNKQSSVEWFAEQTLNAFITKEKYDKLLKQAKAMHKEEHGKTWDKSMDNLELRGGNHIRAWVDFEEYYNETYGGNK